MFFLYILGIAASVAMIKYREKLGDIIGDAEWMQYVGGVYNAVIIAAVLLFFWSIAGLTGTTNIFLYPLTWIFGGTLG